MDQCWSDKNAKVEIMYFKEKKKSDFVSDNTHFDHALNVNNPGCDRKHIHVTCAIIEYEGRVLATQRSATMSMPHKWEFPGGKIEPGETAEECLCRELQEEIGIKACIGRSLPASTHQYPTFTITLHPFVCTIEEREIILHEHAALTWLQPSELPSLDWAEADVAVVAAYISESGRII